jgi:hypothetical protein
MRHARQLSPVDPGLFTGIDLGPAHARASSTTRGTPLGVTVQDLLYVGVTIVVFAVLILIVKGVEHFER